MPKPCDFVGTSKFSFCFIVDLSFDFHEIHWKKLKNDSGLSVLTEFMLDFHASYADTNLKSFDRMAASSCQQLKLFANASINLSTVRWSRIILAILSFYTFLCKQNFRYWFSMDTRCSSGTKWTFIKLKLRSKRTTGNYVHEMKRKNHFHQWLFRKFFFVHFKGFFINSYGFVSFNQFSWIGFHKVS